MRLKLDGAYPNSLILIMMRVMSTDARPDSPINEPQELSRLWDRAFPVSGGRSYTDDFPIWNCGRLEKEGQVVFFKARDPSKRNVVSVAGVRLARLRVPSGSIPIALIGGVATTPEVRGQGLASQCVKLAMDWARHKGATLIALWGSEHAMYQKLGFELCGEQVRVPLQALMTDAPIQGVETLTVNRGWTPGLMLPLLRREGGLALAPADEDWLSAHAGTSWYWTGNTDRPSAYAALGRGIDLQHLVHEWGGSRAELWAILRAIRTEDPDAQILGHPSLLQRQFRMNAEALDREFLAMVHVVDPVALFRAYHPLSRVSAELTPEGWNLAIDGVEVRGMSPLDLSRYLLGPGSPREPLPLWIWGVDAV